MFFRELFDHLARMALFKANAGSRHRQVCGFPVHSRPRQRRHLWARTCTDLTSAALVSGFHPVARIAAIRTSSL